MAKIFVNKELNLAQEGEVWSSSNGATRRTLAIINKIDGKEKQKTFRAQLGTLDKGNHSFIFINEDKKEDERVFGIFLNSKYSYEVIEGEELFSNFSLGGPGNSCSRFGIYKPGTKLRVNTYQNRREPSYFELTKEKGWIEIPAYEVNLEYFQDI